MQEREIAREQNRRRSSMSDAERGRQRAIDAVRATIEIRSDPSIVRGPEIFEVTHWHAVRDKHRRMLRKMPGQEPCCTWLEELACAVNFAIESGPRLAFERGPEPLIPVRLRRLRE